MSFGHVCHNIPSRLYRYPFGFRYTSVILSSSGKINFPVTIPRIISRIFLALMLWNVKPRYLSQRKSYSVFLLSLCRQRMSLYTGHPFAVGISHPSSRDENALSGISINVTDGQDEWLKLQFPSRFLANTNSYPEAFLSSCITFLRRCAGSQKNPKKGGYPSYWIFT